MTFPFSSRCPRPPLIGIFGTECEEIPIEQRDATEVKYIQGLHNGEIKTVLLTPEDSPSANYAFDVTPSRLVTGLITERGICDASEEGVLGLYPEKMNGVFHDI